MNPSEPRLKKIPFILTDLGCLGAAALIGYLARDPFAPWPLVSIVLLVLGGGGAALCPFLSDYAADCREATARTQAELEEQLVRVQAANESLTRAAAHLKVIEEAVHKSARDAETLPYRMAEKLAEFNEALAAKETEDREALERELEELRSVNSGNLKSIADKIQKATADWTALEGATRQQLARAQDAAAKIESQLKSSLARAETPSSPGGGVPSPREASPAPAEPRAETPVVAAPRVASAPPLLRAETAHPFAISIEARPAAAPATPIASVSITHEPAASPAAETAPTAVPAPEAFKIKKPRPPRKPKPEDTLLAMSETPAVTLIAAAPQPEPVQTIVTESAPADESESATENGNHRAESASSSDGATRLLATAYIGIGNKLFVRGDGPGLSWERGVPMQFVSIGKWGWATHDAAGPVRIKLFKNDQAAALSGELTLEPGRHTEITALF